MRAKTPEWPVSPTFVAGCIIGKRDTGDREQAEKLWFNFKEKWGDNKPLMQAVRREIRRMDRTR